MWVDLYSNNRYPYFYSSHEDEDERRHDYTNDMKMCHYCGWEFAGCYMHGIVVTRKGIRRELWRCDKCREDMKTYKVID